MTIRCLLALSILAVMAVLGYFVNRDKTRLLTESGILIDLASRQSTLMSRIGTHITALSHIDPKTDPSARGELRNQIRTLADEFESTSAQIYQANAMRGIEPAKEAVAAIYDKPPYNLRELEKRFLDTARRVTEINDSELSHSHPDVQAAFQLASGNEFFDALERIKRTYDEESQRSRARLRTVETSILVLTLLVLLATGIGVFLPMIRQVIWETDKLENTNSELDQRAAELAETLKELEVERDERRSRMSTMAKVMEDLEEERGKLEREIQARQLVQEALEASEQRFYAIIESAPTAMVMTDRKGTIVLANAETARLFGYDREEILGQPIEVLVPNGFRDAGGQNSGNIFTKPGKRRMGASQDLVGLRKDGRKVPVEIGLNPIATEEGLFVLSAIVDITERKRHEEILRQSEERVRSIVDSALDAVVTIDGRGNITGWNPQAEVVFGWSAKEVLGKSMASLIIPVNWREAYQKGLAKYLATGEARVLNQRLELSAIRRNGQQFPIEISISPLKVGENYEFSAFVRDITARKQTEEEIKRINKELQRKNNEMQQFVYTVSHDLKSPLVTCRGFVGLMKEDALEGRWDDVHDSIARIERATLRMGDLIEDLLQLSRIGVIRNEPELVNVGQLLRGIAEDFSDRLEQANATLEIEDDLPRVVADPVRLGEVFENLLSNAIKYGCRAGNGCIEIGGTRVDGEIRYFVRDHGPGIAKEFHQKIFGLFQRLESNQEGTGVGLAAVARILEIHGGRVWVESEVGRGATFWIAFPVTDDRAATDITATANSIVSGTVAAGTAGG